jgi:hypothetical protein
VTPSSNPSRRPRRASRAWRFVNSELRALRDLRRRVGIRQALVERVKLNLELDGVDGAALSALVAEIEATRAELVAARETLAATYQDVKRYETAVANRATQRRKRVERQQQRTLDEIGIDAFRRRKNG